MVKFIVYTEWKDSKVTKIKKNIKYNTATKNVLLNSWIEKNSLNITINLLSSTKKFSIVN